MAAHPDGRALSPPSGSGAPTVSTFAHIEGDRDGAEAGNGAGAPAISTFPGCEPDAEAQGLAFDAAGNLYVANYGNDAISKVTPAGVVSTFVSSSSGLEGPCGLAFDAAGNLYVANYDSNTISKVTPAGVVSTFVSSSSELDDPTGLAFDAAGNLYVANYGPGEPDFGSGEPDCGSGEASYGTISEVTPAGVVSTFVSSGLNDPSALAFDAAGNLYVANNGTPPLEADGTISEVTPAGVVSTFVGSGLNYPAALAFDAAGNLYVANFSDNTISEVTPAGAVSTFVSSGLDDPIALAYHAGDLYAANTFEGTISEIAPPPIIEGQAFSGTVFHFTDANPLATASDYTAVVTLGDGNSVTLNSSGAVSGPARRRPDRGRRRGLRRAVVLYLRRRAEQPDVRRAGHRCRRRPDRRQHQHLQRGRRALDQRHRRSGQRDRGGFDRAGDGGDVRRSRQSVEHAAGGL